MVQSKPPARIRVSLRITADPLTFRASKARKKNGPVLCSSAPCSCQLPQTSREANSR